MLTTIGEAAWRLDEWLKARVGRLYTWILASSLVAGIVASGTNISHALSSRSLAVEAATVVVQVALLVNQLAQLHGYRQAARERRAARKAAKAAPGEG